MEMAATRIMAAMTEVAVRFVGDHDPVAGERSAQQLFNACASAHARDGISRAISTD